MSLDNLTPITGAWLIIAIVALAFAVLNLSSSRADVRASIRVQNYRRPTRLLIATGAVHRNWVKVGVFGWWTFLGLLFGLFEPPPLLGLSGVLGLVVTAAGLAYTGFHETRERAIMADLLADDIAVDVLEDHDAEVADAKRTSRLSEQAATAAQHDADIAQATVRAADRMGRLMHETAVNTERIANNTDPERSP